MQTSASSPVGSVATRVVELATAARRARDAVREFLQRWAIEEASSDVGVVPPYRVKKFAEHSEPHPIGDR